MLFRSLAARALVPVALTVTGFVVVCSMLLYSFIRNDLVADTIRHEAGLADTIVKSARYAMLKDDRESLGRIIDDVGEQELVEHVRIFNKKGLVMFSADPSELHREVDKKMAGCVECHFEAEPVKALGPMEKARRFTNADGKHVLAITAPIYNEPSCYAGGCHVHDPSQEVLGTLDIGLSQAPLEQSLGQLRIRLAVFCLMVLALTLGGVSALLRRNILLPVRQLVLYADALDRGDLKARAPKGISEVEVVARLMKGMAMRGARRETSGHPVDQRAHDASSEF